MRAIAAQLDVGMATVQRALAACYSLPFSLVLQHPTGTRKNRLAGRDCVLALRDDFDKDRRRT
jgi:hypothetical protein